MKYNPPLKQALQQKSNSIYFKPERYTQNINHKGSRKLLKCYILLTPSFPSCDWSWKRPLKCCAGVNPLKSFMYRLPLGPSSAGAKKHHHLTTLLRCYVTAPQNHSGMRVCLWTSEELRWHFVGSGPECTVKYKISFRHKNGEAPPDFPFNFYLSLKKPSLAMFSGI